MVVVEEADGHDLVADRKAFLEEADGLRVDGDLREVDELEAVLLGERFCDRARGRPALLDEDLAEALVQQGLQLERLVDLLLGRVTGAHEQLAKAHGSARLGDGCGFHEPSIGRNRPPA